MQLERCTKKYVVLELELNAKVYIKKTSYLFCLMQTLLLKNSFEYRFSIFYAL